jgi:hypothetical protein
MLAVGLMLSAALAQPVFAQTMSTQATASAFHYQGNWLAGTEQTQSFPLVYFGAQKGQIVSLGAREIIVPGSFNAYGALVNYQPDISKLIAKTTFNPDQFSLSFDVMGGLATLPDNTTKPSLEGRVNFAYAFTPSVALTGAYAGGGLIGRDRFGVVSAGLRYMIGAGNAPSMAIKRMVARAAAKRAAARSSSAGFVDCAHFESRVGLPCAVLASAVAR